MQVDEIQSVIRAAGGGDNALPYAEALCEKVNRIEALGQCAPLLAQLRTSHEEGDFRGRVLEVNFADCFARKGIALAYGIKQGMPGDIDFGWKVADYSLNIESKLLGQDRATRDQINAQLEDKGMSATFVDNDIKDVARLQSDLMQKASTRKFNPKPAKGIVNIVAIDVSELQLGTVDICDCLLAAGGNTLAARHCDPACLRESVVGAFENIVPEELRESQRSWLGSVQKLAEGVPHPRTYLHGALFLFREPKERAALSYELRGAMVWNPALVAPEDAKTICAALHDVIPREK